LAALLTHFTKKKMEKAVALKDFAIGRAKQYCLRFLSDPQDR
jgi:hypothetical protein